jgi:hypothetical protein
MLLTATALGACGGKPFNVKPRPGMPQPGMPAASSAGAEARTGEAVIRATAVKDEDYLYETFDANLIMAGILPVRVRVTNAGAQPLDLDRARFEIRAQNGRGYKAEEARKAYKRLISFYGITTYSEDGYKESREDFSSYAFDREQPLGPGESRQGLLFFPVPSDVATGQSLKLQISRLGPKQSRGGDVIEIVLD